MFYIEALINGTERNTLQAVHISVELARRTARRLSLYRTHVRIINEATNEPVAF